MFGGMNPKKIEGMMKKMGISQTPLNVKKVIFEMSDGNLVIDDPSVTKIMMNGQETYQVAGEAKEEGASNFSDEDIFIVKEQSGKSEEEARAALEETDGDIAEAIKSLSGKK